MIKKILLLSAGLLFAAAGTASAAPAQDCYPLCSNGVTSSDTTVSPGESITLSARTFQGNVTFTLFSEPVVLGTVAANSDGVATITTTIPANTSPGTHRVEATGTGVDGQPLTVVLSITVAGSGAGGVMARTGTSSTVPMTQVAIAALAGGGLLVLMANKRRGTKVQARDTAGV